MKNLFLKSLGYIFLFLGILSFIFLIIFSLFNREIDVKQVDCYDKLGNVINGFSCTEKVYIFDDIKPFIGITILFPLFILLGFLFLYMDGDYY